MGIFLIAALTVAIGIAVVFAVASYRLERDQPHHHKKVKT